MSGLPLGGRDSENGSWIESVVLQHVESEEASPPRLRTDELSWREVRDALWFAQSLRPAPESGRPRPAEADTPERPEVPSDDPRPAPTPTSEHPQSESEHRDRPVTARGVGTPGQREDWTPGATRFVRTTVTAENEGVETAPLLWPTAPALPNARRIARALRVFAKTSPSPWKQVLDEDATATSAAENGTWVPQWRPAPWHRFEVALIVDTASSMDIWQHTVREFRELLQRQGAFRNVRTYHMDFSVSRAKRLALRTEGASDATRHWRELVDPAGRRIVLVLTDAISAAWRNGAACSMLAKWGRSMPVAVVQVLPQRLWHWSGLSPQRMSLSAATPGLPNQFLRTRSTEPGPSSWDDAPSAGVVIPVLGLTPEWMSDWARLVAVPGTGWIETTAVFAHRDEGAGEDTGEGVAELLLEREDDVTPRERVHRFRTFASGQASQLAGLLAAAPLNLPTIKLIQRVLLPGSELAAVAEVLLGGLLRRLPPGPDHADPTAVAFEFHDGVRAELLAGGRRADTVRVARLLGDYAGGTVAALRNFRDAIDEPERTEYPQPSLASLPYLRVQEAVFRALSGRYARRAKQLSRRLGTPELVSTFTERVAPSTDGHLELGSGPHQTSSSPTGHSPEDDTLTTTESQPLAPQTATQSPPGGDDVTAPSSHYVVESGHVVARQPQVWGSVPLRNPEFVGREDLLEQLRLRLAEPGTTAVLPEALHGMGGVGKSQTVVEYIYRHAAEYDVIWWIAAEHSTQIRSSFVELAKQLGVPAAGSAETAVPGALEALRKGQPFNKWLLVFDNADRPDVVTPFFPAGAGHIVVTSRNSQWAGVARPVEVDLFTREESKELLRRRGGEITDSEADNLAGALGDLPLAIEQAAAWRAQTGMPVAEYLQLLEQNRTELLETGTSGDYQLPVAAAWNVPLARLRAEHPAALEMLQICAFFGPEPISRSLFTGVRGVPVPDAFKDALSDPIKLNRAIREISRYSLAKIDHRSNTLQLHRLVQAVLKNQVAEADQDAMRHAVHILLVNGAPNDPNNSANWPRYAELLPHARTSRAVWCKDSWVRELITDLVRYLLNAGDYGGALDLSSQAWRVWRETLGEDDVDTLTMARQYGHALRRLGRLEEARQLNQKTYDLLVRTVGEDHESILRMTDALATDLRVQGLFLRELEMRQTVFDRARQILGEEDPNTLVYANNLASCFRLAGQYPTAREIDEDTWRRRSVVLGSDHQYTLSSLNALAIDLRECGLYTEAAGLQEGALLRQRDIFGDDHPQTVGAARSLAVTRLRAGDYQAALELAKDCFERYRRRHGELHEDAVTALMNVSTSLRLLADLAQARELGQRSLGQFEQIYGVQHPFTLVAVTNLAVTSRLLGEVRAARELDERALNAFRAAFSADHPYTLVAAANLASDLAELGEASAAHDLDVDTLERSTRVLGDEHPATLAVALNLSLDVNHLGRVDEAAILHTKTVNAYRKTLGETHPATVAATQLLRANCDTDTMQL